MKKFISIFALLCLVTHQASAGWYFEVKTTGDGAGGQAQADMINSVARTWVSGDNMKSEFVESKNPMMPAGTYMVSTNGGASIALVNPAKKTYAPFDVAGFAGGAMKMMGGMMKLTEPKVEKLLDEDGGKLLGQPVRHYKFRTTYRMEMNMVFMKTSTQVENIQEIWAATKIQDAGAAFWKNKNSFSSGDENFDKLIRGEMEKIQGLPLKQTTISRTTDQNGSVTEAQMTMEVTSLKEQKLDNSVFAIPADYTEASIFSAAMDRPAKSGTERKPSPGMDPKALMEMMKKMTVPPAE